PRGGRRAVRWRPGGGPPRSPARRTGGRSGRRCRPRRRCGRRAWSAASSGLLHEDERAARTRQRALDEEEVPLGVSANDAQLLDRRALVAHVAGHSEASVDATRRRARTDRARLAVMVRAVGRGPALEVVALDVAGKALALREARHVDDVARGEHVGDRNRLAKAVVVDFLDPKLAERARLWRALRELTELAGGRLADLLRRFRP